MRYILTAFDWLNPAVHILGLGIAVWAYRLCRKNGYLIVAVYFALAVFSLLAMPRINRIIAKHRTPDVSAETQRRMNEAVQETIRKFREAERVQNSVHLLPSYPLPTYVTALAHSSVAMRDHSQSRCG